MQIMKSNTYDFLNEIKPYGLKYNRDIELKDIAKMIRKELKPLVKLGFKFSVRTKHYTSIEIRIIDIPIDFILYNPYYDPDLAWKIRQTSGIGFETGKDPSPVYTELGLKLGKYINAIGYQWHYGNELTRQNSYFLFVIGLNGCSM